jgi:hypothetical protein
MLPKDAAMPITAMSRSSMTEDEKWVSGQTDVAHALSKFLAAGTMGVVMT